MDRRHGQSQAADSAACLRCGKGLRVHVTFYKSRWHTQFAEVEDPRPRALSRRQMLDSIVSLVAQNPRCLIRFTVIAATTTFEDKERQIHRSLAETLIVLLKPSHHLSSDAAKTRHDSHGAAAESRQRSS